MVLPSSLIARAGFDFEPRTRLVYGEGVLEQLGDLVDELGARRILLVTDPGLEAAGHVGHALRTIGKSTEVAVFAGVSENPTTSDVERAAESARRHAPDLFIALGGGSSIDTAKGASFLLTNGGAMEDYRGMGKATRPLVPLIAVPTTAGTGSEVQSFALIERASDHQKMACGDPTAAPRIALLDPELTETQPRRVAVCTGFDALTHAVESAVTRKRNPISTLFATEAFRLIVLALPDVVAGTADTEARGRMLLGATYAGLAIENSMLGAAHSMANPLTARFPLHHGQAVGALLPHVVRYNAEDAGTARHYDELAAAAGLEGPGVDAIVRLVEDLLAASGLMADFAQLGDAQAIEELAAAAAQQWTAKFNPRDVDEAAFVELYRAALTGT